MKASNLVSGLPAPTDLASVGRMIGRRITCSTDTSSVGSGGVHCSHDWFFSQDELAAVLQWIAERGSISERRILARKQRLAEFQLAGGFGLQPGAAGDEGPL